MLGVYWNIEMFCRLRKIELIIHGELEQFYNDELIHSYIQLVACSLQILLI